MSTPSQPPRSSDPHTPSQGDSAWGQQNSAWGQGNSAWRQPSGAWNQAPAQFGPRRQAVDASPQASGDSQPAEQAAQTTVRQPAISIEQFKPRRNRLAPLVLAVVAVVAFAGIWWLAIRPSPEVTPGASPTPTVVRSAPSVPPAGEFANSTPFSSNGLTGTFTINDSWWDDDSTLSVNVTVQVDTGVLRYRFLVMDMASGDIQVMHAGPAPDGLAEGTLSAGESVTGVVQVTKERGDTQIVLSESTGNNVTMLAVKG